MNYKIEKALKDSKKYLIVFLIMWIVLEILLIAPLAVAINRSTIDGKFKIGEFIPVFAEEVQSFNSITRVFTDQTASIFGKWSLYLAIVILVCTVIFIIKSRPKHEYTDIENGSSDWSKGGEQYRVLSKHKGIILAEDNYLPVNKRGNVNVLIVGGSGSGKSSSYSIPNAHQMLGSYVFTDPKGELYDKTAGYLKAHGYNIKVLNLVNPQNSDGYNPLLHIKNNIDVDVIAHTIVKGQEGEASSSDPFWDDNAETLLKALIYYLKTTREPEEQNLASCSELVRAANSNNGNSLLSDLMHELPMDNPARKNYGSIEVSSDKTFSSILSTLQSKLSKFDSKDIAEVTSTDTINFSEIANNRTALYVISSDTHTTYNFLLTIFFSQLIQQLYDIADKNPGGKLKIPIFFILDEFANIGQIPDFDKKISTSRSRGISFSVILQNLDQLEAVYEKSYETIMGNCDTHVFLGSNSFKTAEYFSKQLGEKTISRDSKSISKDKQFHTQGHSTSDQIMGRALMTPDELRRMPEDDCIIFEKGLKPIKAKKFYYFLHKNMDIDLRRNSISHNEFDAGVRGEWRIFDPRNPNKSTSNEPIQNVKIESLDDLFNDEPAQTPKQVPDIEPIAVEPKKVDINDIFMDSTPNQTAKVTPRPVNNTINRNEEIIDDAPILPMEDNTPEDELFTKDLQEELEQKFDELFGPPDDDEQ